MRQRTYLLVAAVVILSVILGRLNAFQGPPIGAGELFLFVLLLTLRSAPFERRYAPLLRVRGFDAVLRVLEACCLFSVGMMAALCLSYQVQIFARPLQDANFLAFDRAVGFDYPALMRWMGEHPTLDGFLDRTYFLFPHVIVGVTMIGLFVSREARIGERFFTATLVAFVLACAICAAFPAMGAVVLLDPQTARLATGATPLPQLDALRAGTLHEIGLGAAGGLVSFPSMHVAVAVLAAYAVRRVRWFLLGVLPFSLGFCVTALTHGAHYLADCVAGVAVAIVALAASNGIHAARAQDWIASNGRLRAVRLGAVTTPRRRPVAVAAE